MTCTVATPSLVRALTGTTLSDEVISPFLDAAECIISAIPDECISTLSASCIASATGYLAAHLLASSNAGKEAATIVKESLNGKYSVEYLSKNASGEGVLSTNFGSTANMMLCGALVDLNKRPVRFFSIGSL